MEKTRNTPGFRASRVEERELSFLLYPIPGTEWSKTQANANCFRHSTRRPLYRFPKDSQTNTNVNRYTCKNLSCLLLNSAISNSFNSQSVQYRDRVDFLLWRRRLAFLVLLQVLGWTRKTRAHQTAQRTRNYHPRRRTCRGERCVIFWRFSTNCLGHVY